MLARALRPLRKRVQIVFQDPYRSLNPRRTVGAVDHRGADELRPVARARRWPRARAAGDWCGMDPEALDRYPHQFSGGQRQRICIARALPWSPSCWSPTRRSRRSTSRCRRRCCACSTDIRDRLNLAMLFITHDLRVAAQVCDRVAVMQGEVVEYARSSARRSTPIPASSSPRRPGAATSSVARGA
jgi:peptide/nickel transport system ATP-binding protein